MPQNESIQDLFIREMLEREARAEKFTCLIWMGLILSTYALFLILSKNLHPDLVFNISMLVCVMVPAFGAIFLVIHRGFYSTFLRYLNSFLQVSLVSIAIIFDVQAHGGQYALSSMPPMAYGLVLIVTAFRLRPWMGVFAGFVAALEFGLIYAFLILPSGDLNENLIAQIPSLGWEVTGMKIFVLLALGGACSFAAYRLRSQLLSMIKDAVRQTRLENSLGRYVSKEVAAEIMEGQEGKIPIRRVSAVIMFGDIRGFTEFSNQRDPIEVVTFLNSFFETVNEEIARHGGVLNKFLGDGFLAVFGVYNKTENVHQAAVNATLSILEEGESHLKQHGLEVGLALNSGEVIAGEIGSEGRCEFTVIGNTVNVASRIEGFNRKLGTRFLVPNDFLKHLDVDTLNAISHGKFAIRGITGEVELVELSLQERVLEQG